MKRVISLLVILFIVLLASSGLAVSAVDYYGTWTAETVVYEGVSLDAKLFGFDMEVVIYDSSSGVTVQVYSEAMGMDTHDVFRMVNNDLCLPGTSHFEYVDDSHINLFIEADSDSTHIELVRYGESATTNEPSVTATPSSTQAPVQYDTLQKGSKGDAVVALQRHLIELGFLQGAADGDFGNQTKAAVEAFQRDNELTANGIADQTTQEILFSTKPDPYKVSSAAKTIQARGSDDMIVTDYAYTKDRIYDFVSLALTNVSDRTIPELDVQIVFYDENGSVIGVANDGHDAILPGSTVITTEMIHDTAIRDYATVEVVFDQSGSNYYKNHASNLSIVENSTNRYVYLQVTNNDTETIEEIEIAVGYYKDGVMVGADIEEVYDLESGKTHTFEFDGLNEYEANSYRYFINQAHTFELW